jgi:sugar phosphate isomerase/epimerase
MDLKLACADFTFPLLSHGDALDLIARLGVKGVDIGLFRGRSHIRPENVFNDIAGSARQLSQQIRDRGLEIADIFLQASTDFQSLAANHPDPAQRKLSRDAFRKGLEFVARCNATHMTGLPGVNFDGESNAESLDRCASELAWRVEQAKAVGIVYSVEAHLGSLVPTPDLAAKLVEKTPGLTLTLDYGHFTYQSIADSVVEPLMAHASHFHARCARPKRLQAPLKDNAIDYGAVLRAMRRCNYSGWVGLEYVWVDWEHCNEVDNLSETILLRDHLRGMKL